MKYLLCLFILILQLPAYAVSDLIVREKLRVYLKRNTKSKVVSTLQRGDKVVISPKLYGDWRKVLVTYDGERRPGYILSKDIKVSVISDRLEGVVNDLLISSSFGGQIIANFNYQQAHAKPLEGFDDASVDDLSGFGTYFGGHYHFQFKDGIFGGKWKEQLEGVLLKTYIEQKKLFFQGSGELVADQTDTVEVTYTSTVAGLTAKFYENFNSFYWIGGGLEVGLINDLSASLEGGAKLPLIQSVPTPVIVHAGMGWDFKYSDSTYISPEIRAGVFFTESPMVFTFEFLVNVSFLN